MNKETENRNRIRVAKETWRMVCELEVVTEENGEEPNQKKQCSYQVMASC